MPSDPPANPEGRDLVSWSLGHGLLVLAVLVAAAAAALGAALAALMPAGAALSAALGAGLGAVVIGLPAALALRRVAQQARALARVPAVPDRRQGGVASKEFLHDLAEREFARARRYGSGAGLLLVEVDRRAGPDEAPRGAALQAIMQALAAEIAPTLRGADVLARQDGAQLAVFLVHSDPTGALDVAERIRERAEQLTVPWAPEPLRLTVSVGVAHLRPAHQGVQALFDDAAEAVQTARGVGGNCVRAAPVERQPLRAIGLPFDRPGALPGT